MALCICSFLQLDRLEFTHKSHLFIKLIQSKNSRAALAWQMLGC